MNKTETLCLIMLFTIVIIIVCYCLYTSYYRESTNDILYYRISDSLNYSAPSIDPYQGIFDLEKKLGLRKTNQYSECEFLLFGTLNYIDQIMKNIKFPPNVRYVFGLAGSDSLASKSALYTTLSKNGKSYILPRTFVIHEGFEPFLKDYMQDNIYILKKNIQRQEGFIITRDVGVIKKAFAQDSEYVVCQELLQDPLVVGGRKINIRIYLLVIVTGRVCNMYMYNDGFMYYTKEMWQSNSIKPEHNITTGYIDRQVYVENPLTFQDLKYHLGTNGCLLETNIIKCLETVSETYSPLFMSENKAYPGTKFLIYGCDIAPDSNFNVKIMEINKGPDLSYKDDRDKALKLNMVNEALTIVFKGTHKGTHFKKI